MALTVITAINSTRENNCVQIMPLTITCATDSVPNNNDASQIVPNSISAPEVTLPSRVCLYISSANQKYLCSADNALNQ